MQSKKLWFGALILLLIQFILDYTFHTTIDFSSGVGILTFVVDSIVSIITIVLFGLLLGILISVIPYKKRSFRDKFKIALPAAISMVLIILIFTSGYRIYLKEVKGVDLKPLKNTTS